MNTDKKITYVIDHLHPLYGEQRLKPCTNNLKELILTILSHRTNKRDETQAFERMWSTYQGWHAIQIADTSDLIETLSLVRFPERKAPYIQRTLATLYEKRQEYNIDFLADFSTDDAMAWLQALPGVGIKTASLVMLFCFHRPVIPVDTHVRRVSQRLHLIPTKASAEKAHTLIRDMLPQDAQVLYTYHKLLLKHGQRVCTYYDPKCQQCVLASVCPSARL